MKYSKIYIIYPDNKALEKALAHFVGMLVEYNPADIRPDNKVTVPDNFTNTRGNYEQRMFRGALLDPAYQALEAEVTEDYRQQEPLEWARVKNHFGNVIAALGQQHHDAQLYRKACAAFDSALTVLDQEAASGDRAITQYNLGTAAQALGRQESDPKLLKQAIDAYTNALLVWTHDGAPEEWARTMHQLGNTLHTHGLLLKGNRQLQKSVVAYKNSLKVFNADDHALELAATHINRGAVLHHLAESEDNAGRMEEAIKSYETGLLVCQEQQLPIHLVVLAKVNIATARCVLAELTRNTALAEEVADQFELIIECFPHALQPLCLKHCQEQMAKARSLTAATSASN